MAFFCIFGKVQSAELRQVKESKLWQIASFITKNNFLKAKVGLRINALDPSFAFLRKTLYFVANKRQDL